MASGSIDDLATLSELEENSLMEELQARYNKDIIYVMEPSYVFSITCTAYVAIDCPPAKMSIFYFVRTSQSFVLKDFVETSCELTASP